MYEAHVLVLSALVLFKGVGAGYVVDVRYSAENV